MSVTQYRNAEGRQVTRVRLDSSYTMYGVDDARWCIVDAAHRQAHQVRFTDPDTAYEWFQKKLCS